MFISTLINSFIALFIIIDPIGITPLFVAISNTEHNKNLRPIAIKGTAVAFAVLAFFALLGAPLLRTLGITLEAFRIAGGALLFVISFNMIMKESQPPHDSSTNANLGHGRDWAVFPLAIPLLAGPGSITATILLVAQNKGDYLLQGATYLALLLVSVITVVCLLLSNKISKMLGPTGINVFSRVLGIILAALAIQYIGDGIRAMFKI